MQRRTIAILIAISVSTQTIARPAIAVVQQPEKQVVQPAEFVAFSAENGFDPPRIVVQFDPRTGTGVDYKLAENRPWYDDSEAARVGDAVKFLREGIERLSGKRLEVINSSDLSRGIVLTTLAGATDEIRNDPDVQAALKNDGSDSYNHHEAFYIRSEKDRLLLVANTVSGLVTASAELLESVGYEVLGMGSNWVFVPASPQEAANPAGKDGYYVARDLPYGISCWNSQTKSWEQLVDKALIKQPSVEVQLPANNGKHHLVRVGYEAPRAGTYRFEIGYGGNLALLTDLGFDPATDKHTAGGSLTFDGAVAGLTQSPAYFYIPKGTKSLDLEV